MKYRKVLILVYFSYFKLSGTIRTFQTYVLNCKYVALRYVWPKLVLRCKQNWLTILEPTSMNVQLMLVT